jgi:hypothetical protein
MGESMKGLSIETTARNENYFEGATHLVHLGPSEQSAAECFVMFFSQLRIMSPI